MQVSNTCYILRWNLKPLRQCTVPKTTEVLKKRSNTVIDPIFPAFSAHFGGQKGNALYNQTSLCCSKFLFISLHSRYAFFPTLYVAKPNTPTAMIPINKLSARKVAQWDSATFICCSCSILVMVLPIQHVVSVGTTIPRQPTRY